MHLRSAALGAFVAALYASCIMRSTATATIPEPVTAIQSLSESQPADRRYLRARTAVDAHDGKEERGWFTPKLSAGAEKLTKKQLKGMVDKYVRPRVLQ
ncbi:hypothetical protein PHYSODRAFT_284021 [Phytophthora sojae]|uniref:RxLR effector protein n=2 Tax=Phytophthora sojae TaxID=67593 RepID=G4YEG9_PHYSP|nr:hypothetical protein PHYSODRAFT_284021 [Phytophthora sojae]AEK80930.1 Avh211 [Phytophthora sojae]EGZ26876.1 hypothetical protein PHYSODRAFT_284021 [Phytophthora sojae]|eukprot:XP_009514151.1 hypothetical protein PHYSODRAFT_284021 [Phytophthora sojae]